MGETIERIDGDGAAIALTTAGLVAESPGIGLYAETGLHDALKRRYAAAPGARLEARVGGKVVDVALPGELVEVQTRSLGAIQHKILHLACIMPVRLVHPVVVERRIRRLDPASGAELSSRLYRGRKDRYSAFDELVRAPLIVASANVRVDLALVRVVEERVRDGSGSWRRKGDRTLCRELEDVIETLSLDGPLDWLGLLPGGASRAESWDSAALGDALGIKPERARKILYTFAKAGLMEPFGKAGRRKRYRVAPWARELHDALIAVGDQLNGRVVRAARKEPGA